MAFQPKKKAPQAQITVSTGALLQGPGVERAIIPVWCAKHHFRNLEAGNYAACGCPPGPAITALTTPAEFINMGGARGGTKSETGRQWLYSGNPAEPRDHPINEKGEPYHPYMRVNQKTYCPICVNISYTAHPAYTALVLRRNVDDLRDWRNRARDLFGQFGAELTESGQVLRFPSGAQIIMGHLADDSAYTDYQGQEFHRILIEELTQIKSRLLFQQVAMSCRSTFVCTKGCKPRQCRCGALRHQLFSTCNPGGPGHGWVSDYFVRCGPPNEMYTDPENGTRRIFIPAKVTDNPYFMRDKSYLAMLNSLDEPWRSAWRDGDWNAFGGSFFKYFRPTGPKTGEPDDAFHVVKTAPIAPWWPKAIGMDWGYNHPSCVHWGCVSGDPQDRRIYIYREYHVREQGADEIGEVIARRSLEDLGGYSQIPLFLSPDAFAKKEGGMSLAEQVKMGIERVVGPGGAFLLHRSAEERAMDEAGAIRSIVRRWDEVGSEAKILIRAANNRRVDGWNHMRSLLRFTPPEPLKMDPAEAEWLAKQSLQWRAEYEQRITDTEKGKRPYPALRITEDCRQLIREMQDAQHKEGTEDLEETEEAPMDALSSARYLLMGIQDVKVTQPFASYMQDRMTKAREIGVPVDDLNRMVHIWRKAEHDYDALGGGFMKPITHLPRMAGRGLN